MSTFKTSLLAATMIAGVAVSSAASAQSVQSSYPAPFDLQTYVLDTKITNVAQPAAPLSLADNPFAIEAPGNPQTVVALSGFTGVPTSTTDIWGRTVYTPTTGYAIFDGDNAIHGTGSSAVQNTIARAMNCFGTPNPLANGGVGVAAAAGTIPQGSFSVKNARAQSYKGTPELLCNNGTFVNQSTATAAPAGGILYGANATTNTYFVPGVNTAELQPQFSDYSITTGNVAPYGFSGKYIGTGSGFGKKAWSFGSDVFDDGYGVTTAQPGSTKNVPNPFVTIGGQNYWSHVQFAMSDAPLAPGASASKGQYLTYVANAGIKGGPAVQFPLFVVPISIVYNSVYAKQINGATTKTMTFNVKGNATYPTGVTNGGKVASLQLTGPIYCGIFNGMITNWNDPALTQANKNIPLYDPINDTATRWNTQGAPIRLVGRMDNSGSTDIFTRHLAAVCSQSAIYGSSTTPGSNYFTATGVTAPLLPVSIKKNFKPNKFLQAAESLPYNQTPNLDFNSLRADTHLVPSDTTASDFAGTTNVVSGDYWTGSILKNIGATTNGGTAVVPANPTLYNGSGLFIVANGGGAVAATISYGPDYDPTTGTYNNSGDSVALAANPLLTASTKLLFNGKIGYVSTDVAVGADASVNPTLRSAVLATVPNSYTAVGGIYAYTYYAPTLKNVLSAFNKIDGTLAFLPPESDSTGAYKVANNTATSAQGGLITRSNPYAWTDNLYQNGASYSAGGGLLTENYTLAMPSQGYPFVGTTQMLTYTCFSSAGNREAVANLVASLTGSLTVDSTNSKVNKTAFSSSSAAIPGIIGASSIGIVPAAWQTAIANTFLKATSDVNDSLTGAYATSPLHFTSSPIPTKVKVSAGVFVYTPPVNNTVICNSEGNTASSASVAAGTNTGL